jgi:hypothetical protein
LKQKHQQEAKEEKHVVSKHRLIRLKDSVQKRSRLETSDGSNQQQLCHLRRLLFFANGIQQTHPTTRELLAEAPSQTTHLRHGRLPKQRLFLATSNKASTRTAAEQIRFEMIHWTQLPPAHACAIE